MMLFSTIGFSVDVHFCGGEVKSIGLFEATPCEMEQNMNGSQVLSELPACHQRKVKEDQKSKNSNGFNRSKCCYNENFNFETSAEVESLSLLNVSIEPISAVLVYTAINLCLLQPRTEPLFYKNYRPPLIDEDISVLHQVFRI